MTLAVGGTLKTNTTNNQHIFRISGGVIATLCTQVIRHKLCQYFDIVVYAQSRQMLNKQSASGIVQILTLRRTYIFT